ncbi:aldehyde dehydrogenase (NADP(+)) [Litorimonas sp. RW-G-Af-16]|uniref:aldehyde dehydrogenase (NADP(+)) n=1 Tax=Litorimonas sp. RW-G-Af-16 TaxID=3241168 RepID=UPI00390C42C6
MSHFDGSILIGQKAISSAETFKGYDAESGDALPTAFSESTIAHVTQAGGLAASVATVYRMIERHERAQFLEAIGQEILDLGDALVVRACQETGLPEGRIQGERGRTIGQLGLFANIVRKGEWMGVTVDPAMPNRTPAPKPDLRMQNIALGPVAVFGASNFPLAFSIAGGDTASALAAGCPVIVKGHPAHPGTGEMVARAILRAAKKCGMPDGVFSYLPGTSHSLGGALVADDHIKAVGFTGSRGGGVALMDIAAKRDVPIPVYAEMSSINPVYLMPGALSEAAEELGAQFVGSLMMGAGQFCTNPGLLVGIAGDDLDVFISAAAKTLSEQSPSTMLTSGIAQAYSSACDILSGMSAASVVGRSKPSSGKNDPQAVLFKCSAADFIATPQLSTEMFGSASVIIACKDISEMHAVTRALEGQLTATLHISDADIDAAKALLPLLENKVGRILVGGWPTGVEVTHAMVHGGPFPATSDGRSTSVGSRAIERFLRPVSYQNFPTALLPTALRPSNPFAISRRVDGKITEVK